MGLQSEMPVVEPFYLFTSISPRLGLEDVAHQIACIDSWRSAGFRVVTVNGHAEVARVAAFKLDVEIIAVGEAGKPSISDMLACVRAKRGRHAGIINADCILLPHPGLLQHLADGLDGTVCVVERLDVDANFIPQSDTSSGFDAFFFDAAVLPATIDDDFRIGVPWWDYSFPMIAARGGARIVNVDTPLITHRLHPQGWSDGDLEGVGQKLWHIMRDWHASDEHNFPSLGKDVEPLFSEAVLNKDQLQIFGLACFRWLRGQRSACPQQFLDQDMLPVELLLRNVRVALNEKAEQRRSLQDQIVLLDYEVVSLKAYLAEKDKHLEAIHNSLSWRLTKPLRSIKRMLQGPESAED